MPTASIRWEGNTGGCDIASTHWTCEVKDPRYAWNLRAREPGDPTKIVHLPEQPSRILVLLLEDPREVVTREELRKRLWPDDTIVEFEHSISVAMNRLRQALGDSAENPRYIETLSRRGYRWMAEAEPFSSAAFRGVIQKIGR